MWDFLLSIFIPGLSLFSTWWESVSSVDEMKQVVVGEEEHSNAEPAQDEVGVELDRHDGASAVLESAAQPEAGINPALAADALAVEDGAEQV